MSGQACGQCPALHAEIARQRAVITHLEGVVAWLRLHLAALIAAVTATEALMRAQAEHPTMPRGRLLTQVHERLRIALIETEGN